MFFFRVATIEFKIRSIDKSAVQSISHMKCMHQSDIYCTLRCVVSLGSGADIRTVYLGVYSAQ